MNSGERQPERCAQTCFAAPLRAAQVHNTIVSMDNRDSQLRVLHVVSSAELAGTERALLMLLRAADRAAFSHSVFLPKDGPLGRELQELGVRAITASSPRRSPAYYLEFARVLQREKPALLHLHAERLHAIPARMLRIPVLERKNLTRDPDHRTASRSPALDKFANRFVDMTIVPSEFLRRYYLERGLTDPDRIATVYNGVDLAPFDAPHDTDAARADLGAAPGDIPLLAVGRLEPLKGLDTVIGALPAILAAEPRARLALAGQGPARADLERLAADLGVSERVRFTGARNDVPRLLRAAAVFIHASHTEALSNAVLEAMAARAPVAASGIPGNAEVVEHERTGLLFAPRDPAALAAAALRLIREPDLVRRCTRNARALIEQNFTPAAMAAGTERIYRILLGLNP